MEKIKDNIEANYQIPVSIILYEGDDVVGSILVAIRDFSVDLIVMETYGTSGIRRKILGSKSAEVINKCAVPVITVPPDYKLRVPTNIAIAVDEKFKQQEVLKPVFDLADLFQSKLTVVSFLEESETGKINSNDTGITFMEDDFKVSFNSPACVFLNIKGEDLLNSLNQFVMEKRIDLLVMISRKRTSFQNLFDKSKTQKMSYNIIVPLLSLHQQDLS